MTSQSVEITQTESTGAGSAFLNLTKETGDVGPDTLTLWDEIQSLQLGPYIGELDVKGYTVIPPDIARTRNLTPRLLEKVLEVVERRNGQRPDVSGGGTNKHAGLGTVTHYLLFEDPVFQELLLSPVVLALVTYMVGANGVLSSMQAQLKAAGNDDLNLHADSVMFSSPFASHYQFCNVSINLTEYGPGLGPICFVPGSHKLYRHPMLGEGWSQREGVSAAPGSLIAFTGNTWHSAFARKAPGLRANMLMQFVRAHIRPFEPYREDVTPELLAAMPPRFGRLMGHHTNHGWRADGMKRKGYIYNRGGQPYAMGAHAYD
jgi:hypothetical protein